MHYASNNVNFSMISQPLLHLIFVSLKLVNFHNNHAMQNIILQQLFEEYLHCINHEVEQLVTLKSLNQAHLLDIYHVASV